MAPGGYRTQTMQTNSCGDPIEYELQANHVIHNCRCTEQAQEAAKLQKVLADTEKRLRRQERRNWRR